MIRIVARRLATAAGTLFFVTLIVFGLIHLAPGEPLAGDEGDRRSGAFEDEIRRLYRLDRPIAVQYALWVSDVLQGNLGRSFQDRRPVLQKIRERLGPTLALNALALAVTVGLAVPLGVAAAWRSGSGLDRISGLVAYALYAVPAFWAALLLQILFAVRLDWLPLYGLGSDPIPGRGMLGDLAEKAKHLVLPVACLAYPGLAYLSRFVRANLAESLLGDATRAARARGLPVVTVVLRHAFRQAAVPMLTLMGFLLPSLVGGSVLIERVFAIPGLGWLFTEAVLARDIPTVMGLTLLTSTATLGGILAADLVCLAADPRIRRG